MFEAFPVVLNEDYGAYAVQVQLGVYDLTQANAVAYWFSRLIHDVMTQELEEAPVN